MDLKYLKIISLMLLGIGGPANAALTVITAGELLPDNKTLDFEAAPTGAISSTDSLFTDFGFSNVSLIGTASGNDNWDSNTVGNGLAPVGSVLSIVAPGDSFSNFDANSGFAFQISGTITQFGLLMVDQTNHTTTIETYANSVLVDSFSYTHTGGSLFLESSQPIDEFRVTDTSDGGGWGLDNMVIAGIDAAAQVSPNPIPTLSVWGLGILAGLLGFIGYRRRLK